MLVAVAVMALLGAILPLPPLDLSPDEEDNYVYETIAMLAADPLDLNRVSAEDLLVIPWLDPVLAWRITAYRDSFGGFRSIAQLRQVPGISEEWFQLLAPYVRIGSAPEPLVTTGRVNFRTDTIPLSGDRWAGNLSASVRVGPWSLSVAAENDLGEPILPDWFGAAVAIDAGGYQLCAGDYTFGSGLGLVFSGPHRRFADRSGTNPRGPSFLRPLRGPLESRALRGLAGEYTYRNWSTAGFLSWARRSAAIGADGEVRRVRYDGRHDDSLTLAGRHVLDERSVGARFGYRHGTNRLGLNIGQLGYSPGIAPTDSVYSFYGRSLTFGGVVFDRLSQPYRFAVELAGSSGGGLAGAAAVEGSWDIFRLSLGADFRQAGFYAPLGRWQSTTGRRDRFSFRGRARWTPGPVTVSVTAGSYQDYLVDSLPGRIRLDTGVPFGITRLALGVEQRYRLDEPQFRRAFASLNLRPFDMTSFTFELDEGYPAGTAGYGRTLAFRLELGSDRLKARAGIARFDIAGNTRMYFSEPGVFGPSRSYSTALTGWRFHGAAGARIGPGAVGLTAGYALDEAIAERPAGAGWDMAVRLELGSSR